MDGNTIEYDEDIKELNSDLLSREDDSKIDYLETAKELIECYYQKLLHFIRFTKKFKMWCPKTVPNKFADNEYMGITREKRIFLFENLQHIMEGIDDIKDTETNFIAMINIFLIQCAMLLNNLYDTTIEQATSGFEVEPYSDEYMFDVYSRMPYHYINIEELHANNKTFLNYNELKELLRIHCKEFVLNANGEEYNSSNITDKNNYIFLVEWEKHNPQKVIFGYINNIFLCEFSPLLHFGDTSCLTPFSSIFHDHTHATYFFLERFMHMPTKLHKISSFYRFCIDSKNKGNISIKIFNKLKLIFYEILHENNFFDETIIEGFFTSSEFYEMVSNYSNMENFGNAIPKRNRGDVAGYLRSCYETFYYIYNKWLLDMREESTHIIEIPEAMRGGRKSRKQKQNHRKKKLTNRNGKPPNPKWKTKNYR